MNETPDNVVPIRGGPILAPGRVAFLAEDEARRLWPGVALGTVDVPGIGPAVAVLPVAVVQEMIREASAAPVPTEAPSCPTAGASEARLGAFVADCNGTTPARGRLELLGLRVVDGRTGER